MKIIKSQLREIIREEIQSIKEASLNPVVDKLIKSGNKKKMKINLDHFKRVAQDKLFDKVVNPKAVKYSIFSYPFMIGHKFFVRSCNSIFISFILFFHIF